MTRYYLSVKAVHRVGEERDEHEAQHRRPLPQSHGAVVDEHQRSGKTERHRCPKTVLVFLESAVESRKPKRRSMLDISDRMGRTSSSCLQMIKPIKRTVKEARAIVALTWSLASGA